MTELIEIPITNNEKLDGQIIFVHGLGGDCNATWEVYNKKEKVKSNSLIATLAKDYPSYKIYSANYTTFTVNNIEKLSIEIANKLLTEINLNKPTIVITHSLGGILTKMIINELSKNHDTKQSIQGNVKVVFFAVPHLGVSRRILVTKELAIWGLKLYEISELSLFIYHNSVAKFSLSCLIKKILNRKYVRKIVVKFLLKYSWIAIKYHFFANIDLLLELKNNQNHHENFIKLGIKYINFYATNDNYVDKESASMEKLNNAVCLNATHTSIVKMLNDKVANERYKALKNFLQ